MGVFDLLGATWAYLLSHWSDFIDLLGEHVALVFASEALAVAVAFPSGFSQPGTTAHETPSRPSATSRKRYRRSR